jgi:uncharacterized damage-inducible protein DinB
MNLREVRVLVDYHYWARDRLLEVVEPLPSEQFTRDMGNSFGSIRDTLVHIYSAEWIWHSRWQGESPAAMLPEELFPTFDSVRNAWKEHETKVRAFLENLGEEGMNRAIGYKTIEGRAYTSVFWQMLQHVVNHACYHRGQVTTMLRQLGAKPPKSMDLITFYRERST